MSSFFFNSLAAARTNDEGVARRLASHHLLFSPSASLLYEINFQLTPLQKQLAIRMAGIAGELQPEVRIFEGDKS